MSTAGRLSLPGVALTLVALCLPAAAGGLVYRSLFRRSLSEALGRGLGASFAFGTGLLAWCMMVLVLLGIRLSVISVILALAASASALWAGSRAIPAERPRPEEPSDRPGLVAYLLGVLLAAQLALLAAASVLTDVNGWDVMSLWGPRAIGIFTHQDFFQWPASLNREYPHYMPLMLVWTYLWQGGIADQYAKLVSSAIVLASVLALYWALRRELPIAGALAWCCVHVFAGTFWFSAGRTAYPDVALSLFLLVAVVLADDWAHTGSWPSLIGAALGAAFGALTKFEGAPFAVIILVFAALGPVASRPPGGRRWILAGTGAAVVTGVLVGLAMPWWVAVSQHGGMEVYPRVYGQQAAQLDRLPTIALEVYHMLGTPFTAGASFLGPSWFGMLPLWVLVPLVLVPDAVRRTRTHLLALAVLAVVAIHLFPYTRTSMPVQYHMRVAFGRQMLQIQPLAVYFLGTFFHRWLWGTISPPPAAAERAPGRGS